ncbi:MAG: polyprenyl synthetase family protein [Desulfovibrio sp.]|nr:polyprenyl synthetase family protein [Desulfovibrio sp.]
MTDSSAMKERLATRAATIEKYIREEVATFPGTPVKLREAMVYSLEAGGKRIRPVLCLTFGSLFGAEEDILLPFAAAIEMIHTYSLIHDDLPAMDDDDLRRGKPSCHKAFGEAAAILAGDGLLTEAFLVMTRSRAPRSRLLEATRVFARAAGSAGMVGGQELDMEYTGGKTATLEEVARMQAMKTGAILEASCVCGAILAGASPEELETASGYGRALGKAFQIVDDILDITADEKILGKPKGSDAAAGKSTWPAVAGLEAARIEAERESEKAVNYLRDSRGADADFLRSLAKYIITRVN